MAPAPTFRPTPSWSSTTTRNSSAGTTWATRSFARASPPATSTVGSWPRSSGRVTGQSPRGPQFYLLNANGPTMLRRAVRFAIDRKVDVILFSNTFDGGGNGDGRGPDQSNRPGGHQRRHHLDQRRRQLRAARLSRAGRGTDERLPAPRLPTGRRRLALPQHCSTTIPSPSP